MEKSGAPQADIESKREMLREMKQKQEKAFHKLSEINKEKNKPSDVIFPPEVAPNGAQEVTVPLQQKEIEIKRRAGGPQLGGSRQAQASKPNSAATQGSGGDYSAKSQKQLVSALFFSEADRDALSYTCYRRRMS